MKAGWGSSEMRSIAQSFIGADVTANRRAHGIRGLWPWLSRLLGPSSSPATSIREPSPIEAPITPAEEPSEVHEPAEDSSEPGEPDAGLLERAASLLGLPVAARDSEELEDPRVKEIVEKVLEHFDEHRPGPDAFPSLSLRVLNLVADPNVRFADLTQLISKDPALSAAILKVANSPAYARDIEVTSVRDAIVRTGLDEVARTAGALAARTLFNPRTRTENAVMAERWSRLFSDSIVIAIQASAVAMRIPGARSDQAFLGGLLHDVGKSVALRSLTSLMVDNLVDKNLSDRVIDSVLDDAHLLIGGEVHQEWKLPQYLTVLCVRHHDEFIPLEAETVDLHVVRVVSGLHLWRSHPLRHPRAPYEMAQSAHSLGLNELDLRSVAADLRQVRAQIATSLLGH